MKTKEGKIGNWSYKVRGRTLQEVLMLGEVDKVAARKHPDDSLKELEENARLTAAITARCLQASTEKDSVAKILSLSPDEYRRLQQDITSCEQLDEVVGKNSMQSSEDSKQ